DLIASAAGEGHETTEMYPEFAQIADQEGFKEIAVVFRSIAVAEARHRDRYLALAKNIAENTVFKKDQPVRWVCRNCGYVHQATGAPGTCPACNHPQAHYELEAANY
ncbi:MAG: rubrerythrin family protein, partial [Phycisphaerae bacterium]|nr:rubrerythrin family protein [Phycisphaerae bacterium]